MPEYRRYGAGVIRISSRFNYKKEYKLLIINLLQKSLYCCLKLLVTAGNDELFGIFDVDVRVELVVLQICSVSLAVAHYRNTEIKGRILK